MTGPAGRTGAGPAGPGPGDRAPAFRLRHTFDDDVELAGVLAGGPAVLAFYVFDFGSV